MGLHRAVFDILCYLVFKQDGKALQCFLQVSRDAINDGIGGAAALQQSSRSTCMDVARQGLKLASRALYSAAKRRAGITRPGEWEHCPSVSFHWEDLYLVTS